MADPIHQFQIDKIVTLGHIGSVEIAFTNSGLYMFLAVGLTMAFLYFCDEREGAGPFEAAIAG